MTLYDSSVLIDYLNGDDRAEEYVTEHLEEGAVVPSLAMFEIYQGEIFKSGSTDFDAVDAALGWATVVEENGDVARAAAELQNELHRRGNALAARDAFIAGAALGHRERLAVSDSDFDIEGITDVLDVDFL